MRIVDVDQRCTIASLTKGLWKSRVRLLYNVNVPSSSSLLKSAVKHLKFCCFRLLDMVTMASSRHSRVTVEFLCYLRTFTLRS
jgi:hypothetical protein